MAEDSAEGKKGSGLASTLQPDAVPSNPVDRSHTTTRTLGNSLRTVATLSQLTYTYVPCGLI